MGAMGTLTIQNDDENIRPAKIRLKSSVPVI